jgi:hypothetical protein
VGVIFPIQANPMRITSKARPAPRRKRRNGFLGFIEDPDRKLV